MSKVKAHEIDSKNRAIIIEDFFEIVASLKTKKEAVDFLLGLLTSSEALMMARRIQVAKEIIAGKNYGEIRGKLKVSFQTITKTDHWLNSGDEEYDRWIKLVIKGKNGDSLDNRKNTKIANARFYSPLERYAHHRFMKELFK